MSTLSDKDIITHVKNGEIDYFTFIVKKYTNQIYNYLYKKLPNKDDVEDVVQNSFLNFYKALSRFDLKRPVLPYLFQIAKNELKMHWRSKKSTVSLDDSMIVEIEEKIFDTNDIEEQLDKLPSEQKKAVQLVGEGYSYKEISKELGRPLNTVRTIIRRARLQLQKEKEYDES